MISLQEFILCVNKNAARVKSYQLGKSGDGGLCDCVGLIIGGLQLAGQKYSGIHGSNYFARRMTRSLEPLYNEAALEAGDIVYKARNSTSKDYDLPSRYKPGGAYHNGDLLDYYHIGEVKSVNPLVIQHCSGGGMHYDTKAGKWGFYGKCTMVDYGEEADETMSEYKAAKVVLPAGSTGSTVNMRQSASKDSNLIERVPVGDDVIIMEDAGTWCRIQWHGKTGWMMANYLEYVMDNDEDTDDVISDAEWEQVDQALSEIETAVNKLSAIFGRG